MSQRDDRRRHLLTRGNVDGLVASALLAGHDPRLRTSYVPSGDLAALAMRKDLGTREFLLVDLGLTPRLVKTLNEKAKTRQRVTYLDHHQQSFDHWNELQPHVAGRVQQGLSAAAVAYEHFHLPDRFEHLVALADLVEYCETPRLDAAIAEYGHARIHREAQMLDFAWRYRVDDDRFRLAAARRLATGCWPSEVPEIERRYLKMVNEGRWERALERVRDRIEVKHNVALLRFGRHKPSLFGFGSRALTAVARELGAHVSVLLNRRKEQSSVSLRNPQPEPAPDDLNLGRFVEDFTLTHGGVGGGHPTSAGARIPTPAVPRFLHELYCFA
ncbi:MAG: hypothetical protein ACPGQL_00645 [Thermoplasmatota archaeon]